MDPSIPAALRLKVRKAKKNRARMEKKINKAQDALAAAAKERDSMLQRVDRLNRQIAETMEKLDNSSLEEEELNERLRALRAERSSDRMKLLQSACEGLVGRLVESVRLEELERVLREQPELAGAVEEEKADGLDSDDDGEEEEDGKDAADVPAGSAGDDGSEEDDSDDDDTTLDELRGELYGTASSRSARTARRRAALARRLAKKEAAAAAAAAAAERSITEHDISLDLEEKERILAARTMRVVIVQHHRLHCSLRVHRESTFFDILSQACAYWGLPVSNSLLLAEDGQVWPFEAVLAEEVPAVIRRPTFVLQFRSDDGTTPAVDPALLPAGPATASEALQLKVKKEGEVDWMAPRSQRRRVLAGFAPVTATDGKEWHRMVRFIVFAVAFVLVLAYRRSIPNTYAINRATRALLVDRSFNAPIYTAEHTSNGTLLTLNGSELLRFDDIQRAEDIWRWMEGPLVDVLMPETSGGDNRSSLFLDANEPIGLMRIRQMRVKKGADCLISALAKPYVFDCFAEYSAASSDTEPFNDRDFIAFTWRDSDELESRLWVEGREATYDGSGYAIDLPVDNRTAWMAAEQRMKAGLWIDQSTRAVIINFNTYNHNYNLYSSHRFLFELTAGGTIVPTFKSYTMRLDMCIFCSGIAALETVVAVAILFAIIPLKVKEALYVLRAQRGVKSYMTSPWNQIEFAIYILWGVVGIMRAALFASVADLTEELWSSDSKYVDIALAGWTWNMTFNLDAVIVFLCIMRMFKYFRVNQRVHQFVLVFLRAGKELFSFTTMFILIFFGFVVLGNQIYGVELNDWATLIGTTRTLLKMMVGDFNYEAMRLVDPEWTPFFFTLYIGFVVLIMVNIFLAILNESYQAVRAELTEQEVRLKRLKALQPQARVTLQRMYASFRKAVEDAAKPRKDLAAEAEPESHNPYL